MKVKIIEVTSVSRAFGKRFLEGENAEAQTWKDARLGGVRMEAAFCKAVTQVKEPCALRLGYKELGTFDGWVAATKNRCGKQGIQWPN